MFYLKLLLGLFALLTLSIENGNCQNLLVNETNNYVDLALAIVGANKNLNPLVIQDIKVPLKRNIGLIRMRGHALFYAIVLNGLSKLKRLGDVKSVAINETMIVRIALENEGLSIFTNVSIKVGAIHPYFEADIFIRNVQMFLDVKVDKCNLTLVDFKIDDFKGVTFNTRGLDVLENFINLVADALMILFDVQIRQELAKAIHPILDDEFSKLKCPSRISKQ